MDLVPRKVERTTAADGGPGGPPVDVRAFDTSGLTIYLKDVVTLLLENRPADPIVFVVRAEVQVEG